MGEVSARNLDEFAIAAYGNGAAALESLGLDAEDPAAARCRTALADGDDLRAAAGGELFERWISATRLLNTETYADRVLADPRYTESGIGTPPRKIGSHLELFDCVTCDKCVPVCPNDANFTLALRPARDRGREAEKRDGDWHWQRDEPLQLEQRHQIGNFVDFCNDCGNCDIFCPEDGGPYVMKPRFFGHENDWRQARHLDGFFLTSGDAGDRMLGRLGGREFALEASDESFVFSSSDFRVTFDPNAPEETLEGEATGEVDLTYCNIMDYLRRAVLEARHLTYVATLARAADVEP